MRVSSSTLDDRQGRAARFRVGRSAAFNLVGQCAPAVAALFVVRRIAVTLGVERFGILAVAWAALGYTGLFDLGTGRALTKLLASRRELDDDARGRLVWTSLAFMGALGLAVASVAFALAPALSDAITRATPALRAEVLTAFRLLAVTIPVAVLSTGLRGILEAEQRFDVINLISTPGNLLTYLAPLAVTGSPYGLPAVVATLCTARLVMLVAFGIACVSNVVAMRRPGWDPAVLRSIVRFGGWATVSNVVSPAIVQSDRFMLGSFVSLVAVGYYSMPLEVLSRFAIIPAALASVLFPAFAEALGTDDIRAARLYGGGVKFLFLLLFPCLASAALFAPEALDLWLGPAARANATAPARVLAFGIFANALAFVPFSLIQAAGRPHVTGRLHLVELPLHLFAAWVLIRSFGALGAAAASAVRSTLDSIALFVIARAALPGTGGLFARLAWLLGVSVASFALTAIPAPLAWRAIVGIPAIVAVTWLFARWLLDDADRAWARQAVTRFTRPRAAYDA